MRIVELIQLVAPPRRTLALCLLLMAVNSGVVLLHPWLAGQLAAFLTRSGDPFFPTLGALLGVWFLVLVARGITGFSSGYFLGRTAENILAGLRSRLYDHLLLLPIPFFDGQRRGNILSILTSDSAIISNFVTGTLLQLLPVTITLTGALVMMLTIDPSIALVALVLVPLYVIFIKVAGRGVRPLSRQWIDSYGRLMAHMEEVMGLMPVVKSYTREAQEFDKFNTENLRLLNLTKRQQFILTLMPHMTGLLAGLGLLLLVWLGYGAINAGDLTASGLVSLIVYAMLLNQPLSQLAGVYGQLQNTRGASERIAEFLQHPREPQGAHLPPLEVREGTVVFNGIYFRHPGASDYVLENLDLTVRRGEPVIITGENGAGKSTLVHLLMRLIEPEKGEILIDGKPIDQVAMQSLRGHIGLVAQNTLLINDTVAYNIAWGMPACSREEVEEAARKAKAHDFIRRLPDGYQTEIGDQGTRLSGGQRQRLSLARAMLKDPPLLVFDEATSMMDPRGENEFLSDCRDLFANRTVIFITHRPESLKIGNRVLVLRNGRLEQQGEDITAGNEPAGNRKN